MKWCLLTIFIECKERSHLVNSVVAEAQDIFNTFTEYAYASLILSAMCRQNLQTTMTLYYTGSCT